MKQVAALAALLLLVGCGPEPGVSPSASLPTVPADIQACFRQTLPSMGGRGLNVGEVEELWKNDRVRYVVMRRCGQRFLAWYADLQVNWK